MKVAIVSPRPEQVIADKLGWVADGFRAAGHDVRRCHTLAEVAAADHDCDLLVFDHKAPGVCRNSLADMAPSRRANWVYWWRDLIAFYPDKPLADQPYIQSFKRLMRLMDLVLIKERSLLTEYEAMGIRSRWFDQACPADMPVCAHTDRPQWDVLVLGSASYQRRQEDARAMAAAGLRVLWAGLPSGSVPPGVEWIGWHHPVDELPELVSRCAMVLGVDWRSDLDGFTSDRTYLAAGMGACLVRRRSPGMPDIPSHSYADSDQLCKLARMLAGNHSGRRRIGEAARQCVMEKHTYKHRAEQLVAMLEAQTCVSG